LAEGAGSKRLIEKLLEKEREKGWFDFISLQKCEDNYTKRLQEHFDI